MENLILIGAPGSGKGTQSAMLVDGKSYRHVSTGNLLREEISKESELGLRVKEVMEAGKLVSDELVVELLKANLDLDNSSYIFDGYPRNIEQAKTLEQILKGYDHKAVFFSLDTEVLVERLGSRRVTKDGKNIYNLVSNPPKTPGVCDVTGESLLQRDDDKEEVVRNRMQIFNDTITPVLDFYKNQGILVEIEANKPLKSVYDELISKIK
jgi:adenylate kinase